MSKGSGDKMKGKAKEVTGKVTRNHELETEGKMQKSKGKASEVGGKMGDKLKGATKGLEGRKRKGGTA